jgi:hypothetical protein
MESLQDGVDIPSRLQRSRAIRGHQRRLQKDRFTTNLLASLGGRKPYQVRSATGNRRCSGMNTDVGGGMWLPKN